MFSRICILERTNCGCFGTFWSYKAIAISTSSIVQHFEMTKTFLNIVYVNNPDINIKSKMGWQFHLVYSSCFSSNHGINVKFKTAAIKMYTKGNKCCISWKFWHYIYKFGIPEKEPSPFGMLITDANNRSVKSYQHSVYTEFVVLAYVWRANYVS